MADEYDLDLDQGSKYQLIIRVLQTSLAGLSARMKIRPDKASSSELADWSTYLVVDTANGLVTLTLPADITSAYAWDRGRYDIEVYNPSDATVVYRILQGHVRLDREVTR